MSKLNKGYHKKPTGRALLTDTLPYELPIFFTNFYLYELCCGKVEPNKLARKITEIRKETVPSLFSILKPGGGTRRIGLMHPSVQLRVVGFYEKYDGFIAQLCGKSSLSLRYPTAPASRFFDSRYRDGEIGSPAVDIDHASFESQSEFASSYFAYRRCSHVYKFFDSQEFLDLEKIYKYLIRVDISKCFSSIYTHSLSWAVRGKQFSKRMKARSVSYFESEFDCLVRDANWGETNGIIVGPELMRIFCEIILQSVDVRIFKRIRGEVCIRRYMDDYFIFANSLDDAAHAESVIARELSEYNLYLNDAKRSVEKSPLVSALTISRHKVNDVCARMVHGLEQVIFANPEVGSPRGFVASDVIREVRAFAKQFGVDYGGLAAPALAVLGRRLHELVINVGKSRDKVKSALKIQRAIVEVIKVADFFYLSDVRCSTSNKLARLFLELASLCDGLGLARSFAELQMLDVIRRAMSSWKDAQLMDLVNAVVAVQLICGSGRCLGEDEIRSILGRGREDGGIDYLRLITGLFLCGDREDLRVLRLELVSEIAEILSTTDSRQLTRTDAALLMIDFLACPYVDIGLRIDIYRGIYKRVLGQKDIDLGQAKGDIRRMERGLRFTEWKLSVSSLASLRALLQRSELRLAYD